MMKKGKKTAQFSTLIRTRSNDAGEKLEEILDKKGAVEKEVCKFYKGLYKYREVEHAKEEILNEIGADLRTISEMDKGALENPISLKKFNICLKATRNNVSPGDSGFLGAFYKFIWLLLNYVVPAAIHQIFIEKRLLMSQRLGIICLILKGDKDKRHLTNWRPLTVL